MGWIWHQESFSQIRDDGMERGVYRDDRLTSRWKQWIMLQLSHVSTLSHQHVRVLQILKVGLKTPIKIVVPNVSTLLAAFATLPWILVSRKMSLLTSKRQIIRRSLFYVDHPDHKTIHATERQ